MVFIFPGWISHSGIERSYRECRFTVGRGVWYIINIRRVDSIMSPEEYRFPYELKKMYNDTLLIWEGLNPNSRSWVIVNNNTQGIAFDTVLTQYSLTVLTCDTVSRLTTRSVDTDFNIHMALGLSHLQLNILWSVLTYHGSDNLPDAYGWPRMFVYYQTHEKTLSDKTIKSVWHLGI